MKYIKLYEEFASAGYHRTMGFKYSDPTLRYSVVSYCTGVELSKEDISSILKDIGASNENIEINKEEALSYQPIEREQEEEGEEAVENPNANLKPDYVVRFDILVYDEREIDKIITDYTKSMAVDYGVRIVDIGVSDAGKPIGD